MSPKIDLPIYFGSPIVQCQEMKKFVKTLTVHNMDIKVLIPKNIYQITIDFRYKKEWKVFCEKFWGEKYFNEYISRKRG